MTRATKDIIGRALTLTQRLTTGEYSSRLTGRPATTKCADELRAVMDTFCDETYSQDFSVRPGGFLGFIRVNVVIYFLILAAWYYHQYLVALLLSLLSLSITVFQFYFYKEYINFLFKKRTARNVWGKIEPTEEVLQQVYVTAHHDSAHVTNFLQNNAKNYNLIIGSGMGISTIMILAAVISYIYFAITGNTIPGYQVLLWIFIACSPFVLNLWRFYRSEGTPGAGDNMVCVATAIEVGRHFAEHRPKHTRVIVGSWDAEEAGLRGARAYLKAYGDQVKQVKTYNYNLECFYDLDHLTMLNSDLNGFVQLSHDLADRCVSLGQGLGYSSIHSVPFPFLAGGTDAAEFGKVGIEATTLCGMSFVDRGLEPAYHTLRDTVDAVDPRVVGAAFEIGVALIDELDSKGK